MATITKVWFCIDCDTQLTESETHIHECVGDDIPFMIKGEDND
jgi:hypothetical protein